jgi:hypothetical protein
MLCMMLFAGHASAPPMFTISLCSSHEQQKGIGASRHRSNGPARQGH